MESYIFVHVYTRDKKKTGNNNNLYGKSKRAKNVLLAMQYQTANEPNAIATITLHIILPERCDLINGPI